MTDQESTFFQLFVISCLFYFQLPGGYFVRPFPTHHRAPSQGYLIYKQNKTLKAEYQGLPGPEIGKLVREGVDINDVVTTPEIAYTGKYFRKETFASLLSVRNKTSQSDNEVACLTINFTKDFFLIYRIGQTVPTSKLVSPNV